jgi:hypothetical protein
MLGPSGRKAQKLRFSVPRLVNLLQDGKVRNIASFASRKVPPTELDLQYSTFFVEHSFTCPYCGEEISMVLDLSVHRQTYVEDCEVCCNPIEISYTVQDDALASFEAKMLE